MRQRLLAWYAAHARDLPWRRRRDAYSVWVSEIMLQQTRVQTVIDYYQRFMQRFPDVGSLAAASEEEVQSLWSGLGYYRRARLLHTAVREVVAHYGGQVPRSAADRLALPGVGRYTAGALGSIAFDLPEPLVDGNVARVLCRLFDIATPLLAGATQQRLWHLAEELVQGPQPGQFNQALMELGATVCLARQPQCQACPVATLCLAQRRGTQTARPVTRPKVPPRLWPGVAVVVRQPSVAGEPRVWLQKRQAGVLRGTWGHLLAFKAAPGEAQPPCRADDRQLARQALHDAGLQGEVQAEPCAAIEHLLSHRRLQLSIYLAEADAAEFDAASLRPFAAPELHTVGIAKLTWKILDLVEGLSQGQDSASAPQRRPNKRCK